MDTQTFVFSVDPEPLEGRDYVLEIWMLHSSQWLIDDEHSVNMF